MKIEDKSTDYLHIKLRVNGRDYMLFAPPYLTLLDALRNELGLTGVKCGCDDANCGACTVLVDGRAIKSCSLLAAQAEGKSITTIEGLEEGGELHPLQKAFIDRFAIQCGFCTPGMILSSLAILNENPDADEDAIREGLHGNVCRCTGYVRIVEAVMAVQKGEYGTWRQKEDATNAI